jgi:hypothetical protein
MEGDELMLCSLCFLRLFDAGQLACEHCVTAPATHLIENEIYAEVYLCSACRAQALDDDEEISYE